MAADPRLYLKSGYINYKWILSCGCFCIVIIAPRGTGKTYSILKHYLDTNESIIYARRTQSELDALSTTVASPYKVLNRDLKLNVQPKAEKYFTIFNKCISDIDDNGVETLEPYQETSIACALNTFAKLRSLDFSNYKTLFFDEIIPQPEQRLFKGESSAFLNMLETINRNRELDGGNPIQVVLAGNSDTLSSQILNSIGAIGTVESMVHKNQEVYINRERGLAIFNLCNSPISARKKDTALYKLAQDSSFTDMAISNKFYDLETSKDIKSIPLNELKPFISFNNKLCIYEHKDSPILYCCKHISGNPINFNMGNRQEKARYQNLFGDLIVNKIIFNNFYYDSFDTKVKFEDVIYNRR